MRTRGPVPPNLATQSEAWEGALPATAASHHYSPPGQGENENSHAVCVMRWRRDQLPIN